MKRLAEQHGHRGGHPGEPAAARDGGHPGAAAGDGHLPRLIAWEITRRCNLSCRHCRAAANKGPYPGELPTEECFRIIDEIAGVARPILILTGGDPMLRENVYEIAAYGTAKGLKVVMSPCGTLLTEENAHRLKEAGITRISLSIDGATAETHDDFRQEQGSFDDVMKGLGNARKAGIEFQINTTVTRINLHELADILKLAVDQGAVAFHPFLLVPTGRGKELADQELSPEQYEETLNWVYDQRHSTPIHFKPTCAPHYLRILRQREHAAGRKVTPKTHGMDAVSKGCMGGQSFCFISYCGEVQICGFLDVKCGDLRQQSFGDVWYNSKVFKEMRYLEGYHGRCGYCEYRRFCGGCRARAYETTGHYLDEEPFCVYKPNAKKKE